MMDIETIRENLWSLLEDLPNRSKRSFNARSGKYVHEKGWIMNGKFVPHGLLNVQRLGYIHLPIDYSANGISCDQLGIIISAKAIERMLGTVGIS